MRDFLMSRQQPCTSIGAGLRLQSSCVLRQCVPRKIDGENTPRARNVAHTESSGVRLDAAPTDCEPEAEPGFVRATLGKRQKHLVGSTWRQTAAMILDLDQNAIGDCIGVYGDFSALFRELECVLQQVSKGREKHVGVNINCKASVDIGHSQSAPSGACLEQCGSSDLINEVRKGHQFVPRQHSRGDSHVGKGSIYERTQPDQGTLQYGSSGPGDPDIAHFDGSEGESAGMNEVPELVRKKSQPFIQRLNAIVGRDGIALVGIFCNGFRDAVIEAAVECSKLVYFNVCLALERQIRNGLTQIAIVVNDLIYRKTLLQQLAPVQRSSAAQLRLPRAAATGRTGNFTAAQGLGGLLNFEGLDQLIQKQRNSVR